MNRFLLYPFLLVFLLVSTIGNSQSDHSINHSHDEQDHILSSYEGTFLVDSQSIVKEKPLFYGAISILSEDHVLESNHVHQITLLDIISSEEESDFNCSGGFCMNNFHFHKKGVTLTKQLFDYFIWVSC
ncbi:hypothetical protein [Aquimarina aquimarini]|uniref:hypothetical protein n=1 Tax=Aquimarina aquimarini TaxID=1191734 RepID=UPI000D551111|nr:hypothetical protein [Aquimarina aquimarini]